MSVDIKKRSQESLDAPAMRRAFDQLFAAPDRVQTTEVDDFLAIRVGTRPFAIRVAELSRIEVDRKLVALPGGDSWLLGLANCQGKLVPVHSLELALGFEKTAGEKRWMLITGQDEPLGLAFDALEGYLRIPRPEILNMGGPDSHSKHDQQAVRGAAELCTVVHLPSVMSVIRGRVTSLSSV